MIPLVLLAALLTLPTGAAFAATNAEMEKAIASALVEKLGDDAKTIRVAFFDGKAVLSGQVTEDWTQELAKEVALYVPGVTKVENQVEAAKERSVGTGKMIAETGDASLETEVKDALHLEIGKYSSDVEIETCDGVVSLRGNVPDAARKDLAIATVTKVKKVTKVIDLLRVAG
jgi:osmotically-inducible protein OsmY